MKFPKEKKMARRTIDLVHLAAASVWLDGFIALFALSLDGGKNEFPTRFRLEKSPSLS